MTVDSIHNSLSTKLDEVDIKNIPCKENLFVRQVCLMMATIPIEVAPEVALQTAVNRTHQLIDYLYGTYLPATQHAADLSPEDSVLEGDTD